jgi:transposase-like protein
MKLEAIHDILNNNKSYAQKAIELMLTDPKIIGDWMEKYHQGGEKAITDTHSREAYKHHNDKVLEKEHKKLLEDLERTKAENEYLKKSYSLILKRSKQPKKK